MADLPAVRVKMQRAFSQVGTDFAGPVMLKTSSPKNAPRTEAL